MEEMLELTREELVELNQYLLSLLKQMTKQRNELCEQLDKMLYEDEHGNPK